MAEAIIAPPCIQENDGGDTFATVSYFKPAAYTSGVNNINLGKSAKLVLVYLCCVSDYGVSASALLIPGSAVTLPVYESIKESVLSATFVLNAAGTTVTITGPFASVYRNYVYHISALS